MTSHPGPHVGRALQTLGKTFMRLRGWTVEGAAPNEPKAVFIASPHTSNWDLAYGLGVAWTLDMKISWIGKQSLFRFPFGTLMRAIGGIPIDRSGHHHQVDVIAEQIRKHDRVFLAIAPSGTRSRREYWKSGFYHVARAAGVPLVPGFLDYGHKRGGIGEVIWPSGDIHADMEKIRRFYVGVQGRHPEQATPAILADEIEVHA